MLGKHHSRRARKILRRVSRFARQSDFNSGGWGHPPILNYVDYKTGQVETLRASSETEFFSGTGLAVSFPVALKVSFDRDAAGNAGSLLWQTKNEPKLAARKIEVKEERITALFQKYLIAE